MTIGGLAIEFENYKSDEVIWSDRFEQLLS